MKYSTKSKINQLFTIYLEYKKTIFLCVDFIVSLSHNVLAGNTLTVCYYHVMYEFQSESTLYILPEYQGTPCSKQVAYLKFK